MLRGLHVKAVTRAQAAPPQEQPHLRWDPGLVGSMDIPPMLPWDPSPHAAPSWPFPRSGCPTAQSQSWCSLPGSAWTRLHASKLLIHQHVSEIEPRVSGGGCSPPPHRAFPWEPLPAGERRCTPAEGNHSIIFPPHPPAQFSKETDPSTICRFLQYFCHTTPHAVGAPGDAGGAGLVPQHGGHEGWLKHSWGIPSPHAYFWPIDSHGLQGQHPMATGCAQKRAKEAMQAHIHITSPGTRSSSGWLLAFVFSTARCQATPPSPMIG